LAKLTWGAPERNKQPILEVLQRVLPERGTLLEVASGTGQHATYFAQHLRGWIIQPSDIEPENVASIEARRFEEALPNLLAPVQLDVAAARWPVASVSAIFSANLIHIAPWQVALALFQGAARHLVSDGLLIVYGPFKIGGVHTAPSNQSFDESLRAQDPSFGVRDLDAVLAVASGHGLAFSERIEMPANNQTLIFRRSGELGQVV
jgi:SAM-dependent methyltransferase